MKRLLKNKKGLFGDIGGVIQSIAQTLTNVLPKPVLFILFLLIILFLGNMLSYIFFLSGIFCNTAQEPVKLDGNIFNNFALISEVPDIKTIGLDAIKVENYAISSPTADFCSRQFSAGTIIYYPDDTSRTLNKSEWFYQGQACAITTYCSPITRIAEKDDLGVTLENYRGFCEGNVYKTPDNNKTFWQKTSCGVSNFITLGNACEPPDNYYYNKNLNIYSCADNLCAGKTIGDAYNTLLQKYNAKLIYTTSNEGRKKAYDEAIGITCSELKPRVSVFGIDIFDYKLWAVLVLIMLLMWAYIRFKN